MELINQGKCYQFKILITDKEQAVMEKVSGFPKDALSTEYEIIGILENMKQIHLARIKTSMEKKIDRSDYKTEEGKD